MIYAFSSVLFPLFHQILLDDISAPLNYITLFRYSKRIVHDEIWELATRKPSDLQGKRVLIVYVHNWSGRPENTFDNFIPLRFAAIKKVQIEGQRLYVHFRLKEFPDYQKGSGDAYQNALECSNELMQKLPPTHQPPRVFFSSSELPEVSPLSGTDYSQAAESWERLVDVLTHMEPWSKCRFYRVARMVQIDKRGESDLHLKEIVPLRSGYEMSMGKPFRMELSFYYPSERLPESIKTVTLTPMVSKDHFHTYAESIQVNFPYDLQSVDLIPRSSQTDELTELWLDSETNENDTSGDQIVSAPRPRFMLKLRAPRTRLAIALLLFLLGSILLAASGNVDELRGDEWAFLNPIFAVLGPVISTLGIYLHSRTLR